MNYSEKSENMAGRMAIILNNPTGNNIMLLTINFNFLQYGSHEEYLGRSIKDKELCHRHVYRYR